VYLHETSDRKVKYEQTYKMREMHKNDANSEKQNQIDKIQFNNDTILKSE